MAENGGQAVRQKYTCPQLGRELVFIVYGQASHHFQTNETQRHTFHVECIDTTQISAQLIFLSAVVENWRQHEKALASLDNKTVSLFGHSVLDVQFFFSSLNTGTITPTQLRNLSTQPNAEARTEKCSCCVRKQLPANNPSRFATTHETW